jgi:NADH-quinone oxidoreductase subunit J
MSIAGFLLSVFAVASGLCVVVLRNPLFSAFALVVNLLAVAGLYAVLNAHFLAASQVIVYAGAIMVLVLFVLMLLNLKVESRRTLSLSHAGILLVGALTCFSLVVPPLVGAFSVLPQYLLVDRQAAAEGTVKNIGTDLYTRFVVQFELASLVILVGIVGAVMLANRRKGTFAGSVLSGGDQSSVSGTGGPGESGSAQGSREGGRNAA